MDGAALIQVNLCTHATDHLVVFSPQSNDKNVYLPYFDMFYCVLRPIGTQNLIKIDLRILYGKIALHWAGLHYF